MPFHIFWKNDIAVFHTSWIVSQADVNISLIVSQTAVTVATIPSHIVVITSTKPCHIAITVFLNSSFVFHNVMIAVTSAAIPAIINIIGLAAKKLSAEPMPDIADLPTFAIVEKLLLKKLLTPIHFVFITVEANCHVALMFLGKVLMNKNVFFTLAPVNFATFTIFPNPLEIFLTIPATPFITFARTTAPTIPAMANFAISVLFFIKSNSQLNCGKALLNPSAIAAIISSMLSHTAFTTSAISLTTFSSIHGNESKIACPMFFNIGKRLFSTNAFIVCLTASKSSDISLPNAMSPLRFFIAACMD